MITFQRGANDYQLKGLSTDVKPTTGIAVNSLFLELDTGDFYYFDGEAWQPVGGSGEDQQSEEET